MVLCTDIRLVLLDFDNTIVPYTTSEPSEEFVRWKAALEQAGIRIMVVSNSRKSRRVPDFAKNGTFHGSAMRESPTQRALERPWSA